MELWLPVVGYEGLYEISDHGRGQSLSREVNCGRDGAFTRRTKGQLLVPQEIGDCGHLAFLLRKDGRQKMARIHHLVLEAFVEPRPGAALGLHWDDDPTNNTPSNLRWGTYSDNAHDRVRNGNHHNANKTQCPAGHDYTPENTYLCKNGTVRRCKACRRDRYLAHP